MSALIRMLTVALLALPFIFLAAAVSGRAPPTVPALLVMAIYGWVGVRFRPTRLVRPEALEVRWPLKHRAIRRADTAEIRPFDRQELRRQVGWCVGVGAGGLWGGFGWLWTYRPGLVQMSISRVEGFV